MKYKFTHEASRGHVASVTCGDTWLQHARYLVQATLCSFSYVCWKDNYSTLYPFNVPFSRTTWLSWNQKGKPFWISMKQQMIRWQ